VSVQSWQWACAQWVRWLVGTQCWVAWEAPGCWGHDIPVM